MNKKNIISAFLAAGISGLACHCQTSAPKSQNSQLPNPASQNCVNSGGTLQITRMPGGGEYGICFFEDNRQCEEWALFRKECPAGGIKITGYATDAARFCAITGGDYSVTDKKFSPENGNCKLPDGTICEAADYYLNNRQCAPVKAAGKAEKKTIRALFVCKWNKTIGAEFTAKKVKLSLIDGREITLRQTPSAGGARYANTRETIVFWNKGDTAFINENDLVTYENCIEKK